MKNNKTLLEKQEGEDLPTIDQLSLLFWEWLEKVFEKRDIKSASYTRGYNPRTLEANDTLGILFKSDTDLPDAEANAFIVWEDNFPHKFGYFIDYAEDELGVIPEDDKIKEIMKEKGYVLSKREGW